MFRACRVKDYYLRRAEGFDWSPEECRALLEAALEIDAANASVPTSLWELWELRKLWHGKTRFRTGDDKSL